MTIEQMFLDAGFTKEYIKSREVYLKGYDSITDKVKHMESIEKSKYPFSIHLIRSWVTYVFNSKLSLKCVRIVFMGSLNVGLKVKR